MKVFNLACEQGHRFEGWFSAASDFEHQTQSGLMECPMCASKTISKMPSAPRLNLSSGSSPDRDAVKSEPRSDEMAARWLEMAKHILKNTEDVGERFADEARRIHYNESPARGIRGIASTKQASELAEEGIDVLAIALPTALKGSVQ